MGGAMPLCHTHLMIATALVLLAQPAGLSGSYSGFPGCSNSLGLQLSVLSHSATVQMAGSSDSVQTLTLIKNLSKVGGVITIQVPTHVRGAGTMGALQGLSFAASWDKVPMVLGAPKWGSGTNVNAAINKDGFVLSTVIVKPLATHALRINWSGDILISGRDHKERSIAYDMTMAGTWGSAIGKFNYSIQCPSPSPIFSVTSKTPRSGWQVGPKGAYIAASNFTPPPNLTMYFSYYPNSY